MLAQSFSGDFFYFEFFINHALIGTFKFEIQNKQTLRAFLKKLSWEMENKSLFVYPGLRYAHRKLVFACKSIFGFAI